VQETEKGMLRGIDNNSYMPAPDGQIAGLQNRDPPELVDSFI
jgi:hypothetical protein